MGTYLFNNNFFFVLFGGLNPTISPSRTCANGHEIRPFFRTYNRKTRFFITVRKKSTRKYIPSWKSFVYNHHIQFKDKQ